MPIFYSCVLVETSKLHKNGVNTAQKIKFSIKDIFSKCDQIHGFLRIWSHLLKKSLMENFILLCSVIDKTLVIDLI